MERRAYGFLEIKSVDNGSRELSGWASRVEVDRVGDVVESSGMVPPKGTINLLLDHDHVRSVGVVNELTPNAQGVRFRARIATIPEPGPLQQLCADAWEMVKSGLRAAVSIGFRALEWEPLPNGGLRFTKWEILELSLVSVPAAPGATIDSIKSFDRELLRKKATRVVKLNQPARARKPLPVVKLSDAHWLKTQDAGSERPVATAVIDAMDDHLRRVEEAKELLKHTDSQMIGAAFAAGAKATDAEIAVLRTRLDKLERGG